MPRVRKTTGNSIDMFPFNEFQHSYEWEDDEFEGEIPKGPTKSKSSEEIRDNDRYRYTPLGNALF